MLLRGLIGPDIQPHQLAHAQAAAVKQLGHRGVTRFNPRICFGVLKAGQLHGVIHSQGLGQGFGCLGAAHAFHGVEGHQILLGSPAIKAAPARKNQRNAACAAACAMHLRSKTADMHGLQRQQLLVDHPRKVLQLDQIQRVKRVRAVRQALLHPHMLKVAVDKVRQLRVLLLKRELLALFHQGLQPVFA